MSRQTVVKIEIVFLLAIPVWAVVRDCAGLTLDPFSTVYLIAYFYLLTGWSFFLSRVVSMVSVDWISVGIAGICLIGLVCGLHFFCSWLHREIAKKRELQHPGPDDKLPSLGNWKLRTTLSILGVVLLMFVAGISAVGSIHQLVWLRTRP